MTNTPRCSLADYPKAAVWLGVFCNVFIRVSVRVRVRVSHLIGQLCMGFLGLGQMSEPGQRSGQRSEPRSELETGFVFRSDAPGHLLAGVEASSPVSRVRAGDSNDVQSGPCVEAKT